MDSSLETIGSPQGTHRFPLRKPHEMTAHQRLRTAKPRAAIRTGTARTGGGALLEIIPHSITKSITTQPSYHETVAPNSDRMTDKIEIIKIL